MTKNNENDFTVCTVQATLASDSMNMGTRISFGITDGTDMGGSVAIVVKKTDSEVTEN